MPSPLQVWIKTTKWAPAHAGGGSSGFSVECPATGELGHGKPKYIAEEVLAASLAKEVGLLVPETKLGNHEDQTIAVSKLFGPKSHDVTTLRQTTPAAYASEGFVKAAQEASGWLAFHAWIGSIGDLKDEHVMVRSGPNDGTYELTSIDFADAFRFPDVKVPPGPPVLLQQEHRDPQILLAAIERIEQMPKARIQELVESLPDDVLSVPEKQRITDALENRKGKLREVFQNDGWFPAVKPKDNKEGE